VLAINGNIEVLAVETDVSSEIEVQALYKRAIEKFGIVDVVVSNAGGEGERLPVVETESNRWWGDFVR
jgi:NAD(P)-dependent dehydrogenase (short-subunit alcohol dehydrogenase family)